MRSTHFKVDLRILSGLAALPALLLASVHALAGTDTAALSPGKFTIYGPHAEQKLVLEIMRSGLPAGEVSGRVTFATSNRKVATVDSHGVVRPTSDGIAVMSARSGPYVAKATVHVSGMHVGNSSWSFRNDVLPVLTRVGCNGGSCHGAAAGKGGLKLSLRGYDPESDYEVLTHQANGRRVTAFNPAASLLLLKPTMGVPHGGRLPNSAGIARSEGDCRLDRGGRSASAT